MSRKPNVGNKVYVGFFHCYCRKEIGRGKKMALVEMASIEEAVQALVVSFCVVLSQNIPYI